MKELIRAGPGTELIEETRFPGRLPRITVKHAKIVKTSTFEKRTEVHV